MRKVGWTGGPNSAGVGVNAWVLGVVIAWGFMAATSLLTAAPIHAGNRRSGTEQKEQGNGAGRRFRRLAPVQLTCN